LDTTSQPGSYLVLARRLRPQRFEDVLGQEHVTRSLQSALATNRVAHAYLFCGARGVGKTTVARILARALNCERGPSPEPCGECAACREMASGQAVDFFEIDGASSRGINEIRELRENVRYLPAHGRYKVYLIDEVHMLTEAAFNALLKTLEEPPAHVVFIFATTAPQKLPATILSRCQRYDFKRLPEALIASELARISATEGRELSTEAAALIAREAEGSMRDSLSLLEQVLAGCPAGEQAGSARVAAALGLIDRKAVTDVFAAIVARDAARVLDVAAEVHAFGQDAQQFCQLLLQQVRDALVARLLAGREADLPRLVRATPEELAALRELAAKVSQETLQLYFDILTEGITRIRRASHPRLALEMTLLRLATLEPAVPIDEILARLTGLEERLSRQAAAPAPNKQAGLLAALKEAAPQAGESKSKPKSEPAAQAAIFQADAPQADTPQVHVAAPAAEAAAQVVVGDRPAPVAAAPEPAPGPAINRALEPALEPAIEPTFEPEPAPAFAPEADSGSGDLLARIRAWAQEKDGLLFAALGGASVEHSTLRVPPGFFAPDDLRRRAKVCLSDLGLALDVSLGQAGAAAAAARPASRPATLEDVREMLGARPPAKER